MDLAQTLFEHGHLSAEQLIAVRNYSIDHFATPVGALRELKFLAAELIPYYFRQYFNVQAIDNDTLKQLDSRLAEIIPEDLAFNLRIFCVGGHRNRLFIAMEDPSDLNKRHEVEFFIAKKIVPVTVSARQMDDVLKRFYKNEQKLDVTLHVEKIIEPVKKSEPKEQMKKDDPIDALVTKVAISNENIAAAQVNPHDLDVFTAPTPLPAELPLETHHIEDQSKNELTDIHINIDATPTLDLTLLASHTTAALIKIGFCKTKADGLAALNAKISELNVQVAYTNSNFLVEIPGTEPLSISLDDLTHPQSKDILQILLPALRRIAKLA